MDTPFDIVKKYTEIVETEYPKLKHLIIGEISTEDYIHVLQLSVSVMMHRDNVRLGGGFVQSICDNNLRDAVNRADSTSVKALPFFVYCYNHLHYKG